MNVMNVYLMTNMDTANRPGFPHTQWLVYAADKPQALAVSPDPEAHGTSLYREVSCELIGTSFESTVPSVIMATQEKKL
jgi:hypothetical protein